MTVVLGHTKRFTAASPVTRYWLAHCVGFSVTGGRRGSVERVVPDDDPHVPAQLVIRRGRRLQRVPISAVLEIDPVEHVLVVRGAERAAAVRKAAVHGSVVLGHAAVVAGHFAALLGILLLRLATWLVRAGKEGLRLVRSLPWQQYGRSVRSVTTRLWQDLSMRSSRLRTTSSAWISAKRSSKRARTTSST
jgi:hypothetical protein